MSNIAKNKLALLLIVSLAIASALSALYLTGFLYTYNIGISDSLYGSKEAVNYIAIIGIDDKSLQEIGRWPWDRSVHAQLLDKIQPYARIAVFDISFFEPSPYDEEFEKEINETEAVGLVLEYTAFSTKDDKLYGEELIKPILRADFYMGFANIFADSDGVVRSFPPVIDGVETYDSLDVAVAEEFTGSEVDLPYERVLINYVGPPFSFEHYSYSDLLSGAVDPSVLEGKIVLIGATAPDLRDTHLTPISNAEMSGVEVHANAIQTILENDFLDYQDNASVVLVIFLLSIVSGLLIYRLKISLATIFVFILAIVYIIAAVILFDYGLILNIIYPILALVLVYVGNVAVFYVTESKQRRLVTNVFGKYVSKEVANEILKMNTEELHTRGAKRTITILFSDIRGFTSISEKLTPEQLVEMLNKYLSAMTDVIMDKRGVVDKYIGDAIMAFWGAPLEEKQHARLACEAALEMKHKLAELNIPGLSIGVGINTGEAIVGNMGSKQRVNYTAIGDAVNASSRMEGLNKEYGTMIIIGENTHQEIKDDFVCRELDLIKVKGKDKPIRIYELAGKKNEVDKRILKSMEHFSSGLIYYRKKKWNAAIAEFKKASKIKDDKASAVFIDRCATLKKHPPKHWDGIYTAKTK